MEAVADTANTAAISKRCAAQLGYFGDAFADWFDRSRTKCAPIINRGTYVRVAAIDAICEQFAPSAAQAETSDGSIPRRQILSLGAGLDTRAWRMRKAKASLARYIEVDLPRVVEQKLHLVRDAQRAHGVAAGGSSVTGDAPPGLVEPSSVLAASEDALVSADLSDLGSLRRALDEARFDPALPTLVLIECVLVYMEPAAGSALLRFLAEYLPDAACLAYEMIRPDDAFGRQMRANLANRGLAIPGIDGCSDGRAHEQRFAACGWVDCEAVDMLRWYERWLPRAERVRVERIEWLDEMEEWRLLLGHYCFVLARTPPRVGSVAAAGELPSASTAQASPHGGWASTLAWAPPGPPSTTVQAPRSEP